uniref:SERTA domain-containing protein n=1 Tax=Clastoptera arizonana TaxID=38151 RepID=A0A1B6C7A8_9HEMI
MRPGGLVNHNNNTISNKEEEDDIFNSSRGYGSFCTGRPNRPTMISAKYRQKEERRKVLKISINKLKKIEDPESSLRRSVLINNTMKKLQKETREEKLGKQTSSSYRCFTPDFLKDDENTVESLAPSPMRSSDQLADITNLPEVCMNKPLVKSVDDSLGCDESMPELMDTAILSDDDSLPPRCASGRKRSFDEVDDTDVQDVLSQFYMPPTPRMLTSIDEDEDEDVNVVDLDTPEKRPRLEEPSAADRLRAQPQDSYSDLDRRLCSSNVLSERCSRLSESSYSCGHSSILQSVVYHSLIASLET